MSLLGEIKRRKMFQAAAIYAVVAWVLVQIVATVEAPLNLPDWSDTLVIVLLSVGFPVTLIISWAFNVTPHGMVRDTGGDQPRAEATADEQEESRIQLLPNSIAVLPFENLSPNPNDAYFSAGVHEQLLNELAKIRDINVIARTSVLQYATEPQPIPQIATALNVQTVMEGSVRYAGEKVRITAQLIDGSSGTHLWTEAYDGDLSDVFAIQTDIATSIAKALEAELLPETRARLEKPLTSSPAAYALFLEAGKYFATNDWDKALPLLDHAIELDSDFAGAYARKAYIRAWMLVSAFAEAPSDREALRAIERDALDSADRALEIDATLGVAWLARAMVNHLSWRWASAERDLERALQLSPNDPYVLREYALFKARKGEHEDALRMARRSAELNPNETSSFTYLGMIETMSGDFQRAHRAAEKVHQMVPAQPLAPSFLGHTLVGLGDFDAATRWYDTAEKLITDETGIYMPAIIYCYGLMGRAGDAKRLFERLKSWSATHNVGAGLWMYAYLGRRDADKAYEWFGRAVEAAERSEPDAGFIAFLILLSNAHDDPILEEPRFKKRIEEIDRIARSR